MKNEVNDSENVGDVELKNDVSLIDDQAVIKNTLRYSDDDDVIDLVELIRTIWRDKWIVIAITSVISIISVFYALSLPNQYQSDVLLAPVSESGSSGRISNLVNRFGGLASMAGISLGGGDADKTTLAIETLKSRTFIINFIERYDLVVPLMAAKGWDMSANKLIIDPKLYDEINSTWVRQVALPKKTIPSGLEAYEQFLERLNVTKNDKTGYIKISFEFFSPYLAQDWLEKIIADLNSEIRNQDINDAQKTIEYLKKQIELTNVAEMHQVFYELIENQTQTVMLANVREEYVFKTIDSAVLPEQKSKPKRAIMVIFATLLGGFVGIGFVLIRSRK